jgi:hypothetical protein
MCAQTVPLTDRCRISNDLNAALLVTMRSGAAMELFMAGGNHPAFGVPLPNGFAEAVQAEIAVAK